MRYFFADELERLLGAAGMSLEGLVPFPDTTSPLSAASWNVLATGVRIDAGQAIRGWSALLPEPQRGARCPCDVRGPREGRHEPAPDSPRLITCRLPETRQRSIVVAEHARPTLAENRTPVLAHDLLVALRRTKAVARDRPGGPLVVIERSNRHEAEFRDPTGRIAVSHSCHATIVSSRYPDLSQNFAADEQRREEHRRAGKELAVHVASQRRDAVESIDARNGDASRFPVDDRNGAALSLVKAEFTLSGR